MKAEYFPVVIEREENGSFSAWVAGLPGVFAAADSAAGASRALRGALRAHLDTLEQLGRTPRSTARIVVMRYSPGKRTGRLELAGLGSLLGRSTSAAKTRASRLNGLKGGRPKGAQTGSR